MEPIIPAPGTNGPWRLLILDRDQADPKWILATVASPADVRPAEATDAVTGMQQAGDWLRVLLGRPHATLTAMTRAHVWRIDEEGQPR